MKKDKNTYWQNVAKATSSLWGGLKLSFEHIKDARKSRTPVGVDEDDYFKQDVGLATLQYPHETFPIPDNGRYRLHNEIEDCIVCDKCAKICPVDCIDIEPVRAVEDLGKTSDGTTKRIHAAKFDIDMAKCCFCGLCTTVCPTECLTMTKAYDFSEFDVKDHNYSFAELTPLEILEKKQALDEFNKQKEAAKKAAKPDTATATDKPKPSFKPRVKPKPATSASAKDPNEEAKAAAMQAMKAKTAEEDQATGDAAQKPKPVFRPKVKPKLTGTTASEEKQPKPVIKPRVKPVIKKEESTEASEGTARKKPVIRAKPKIKPRQSGEENKGGAESSTQQASGEVEGKSDENVNKRPRPVIKKAESTEASEGTVRKKPVIRAKPKIKPRQSGEENKGGAESSTQQASGEVEGKSDENVNKRPRPVIKKAESTEASEGTVRKKPVIRAKPKIKPRQSGEENKGGAESSTQQASGEVEGKSDENVNKRPRPVIKKAESTEASEGTARKKPVIRAKPVIKPRQQEEKNETKDQPVAGDQMPPETEGEKPKKSPRPVIRRKEDKE